MPDFFRFLGERSVGGYRWVETNGKRFLTDSRPNGKPYDLVRYELSKTAPSLFRDFARLYPATEENIRAFAKEYGFLGEIEEIRLASVPHESFAGEPIFLWAEEITAMRDTLELWRLLQRNDSEALAKMIMWKTSPQGKPLVIVRYFKKGQKGLASKPYDAQHRWEKGDVIAPGWYHVQNAINGHMGNGRVSPMLVRDVGIGPLSLYCVPQNLIGALWLQFAQAVARDQRFLQCAYCQKPFLIGGGAKNSHAQYCKDSCRKMASRKRLAFLPQGKAKQRPPTRKQKTA